VGIRGADQLALLQCGRQPVGELRDAAPRQHMADQKTIAADRVHRIVHLRSDSVGRTDIVEAAGGRIRDDLAQRFPARGLGQRVGRGLGGVGLDVGNRLIEIELRKIDAAGIRHEGELVIHLRRRALFLLRVTFPRAFVCLIDDRGHHEQHFAIRGFASVRDHELVNVVAESLCGLDGAEPCQDCVGMLGGEAAPGRGAAGLADHRASLRAGIRIQRTA